MATKDIELMDALEAENGRLREAVLVITREIIEMLRESTTQPRPLPGIQRQQPGVAQRGGVTSEV